MNYIKLDTNDNVCLIKISNSKFNTLNIEVLNELNLILEQIENDKNIKVVVITGEGNTAFIAGADIKAMQKMSKEEAHQFSQKGQNVFFKIENFSKPIIAAINGYALGGGCELALSCHIRCASSKAQIGQPEVKLGLLAGWGGTQRLGKIVSKGKAMEILTSGKIYSSLESFNMGLVDNIFEEKEFMEKVIDLASTISKNSPQAIHKTIELINKSYEMKYQDGFIVESIEFSKLFQEEESNEGMTAFIEKRNPKF